MEILHKQLHLRLLADRRKLFMLAYMYKMSKIPGNVKTYCPEMLLRTGPKVKMKIDFKCNNLWDKLDINIQRSENMYEFKNVKKLDMSLL